MPTRILLLCSNQFRVWITGGVQRWKRLLMRLLLRDVHFNSRSMMHDFTTITAIGLKLCWLYHWIYVSKISNLWGMSTVGLAYQLLRACSDSKIHPWRSHPADHGCCLSLDPSQTLSSCFLPEKSPQFKYQIHCELPLYSHWRRSRIFGTVERFLVYHSGWECSPLWGRTV